MQSDVDLIWESYLDIYENVRIGSGGSGDFLKGGNLPKSIIYRDLPPSDCNVKLTMANKREVTFMLGLESNDETPNYFTVYAKNSNGNIETPSGGYFSIGTAQNYKSIQFSPDKSLPLSMDNRAKMNPDVNPLIKGMTEDDGEFEFRLKDNLKEINITLNKMAQALITKRRVKLSDLGHKASERTSDMLSQEIS